MEKRFLLFNEFGSNILIRNKMREFFQKTEKQGNKKLIFDFKRVDFISRSCADEYLKLKELSNKDIQETNMNLSITQMMETVGRARGSFHIGVEDSSKKTMTCCA